MISVVALHWPLLLVASSVRRTWKSRNSLDPVKDRRHRFVSVVGFWSHRLLRPSPRFTIYVYWVGAHYVALWVPDTLYSVICVFFFRTRFTAHWTGQKARKNPADCCVCLCAEVRRSHHRQGGMKTQTSGCCSCYDLNYHYEQYETSPLNGRSLCEDMQAAYRSQPLNLRAEGQETAKVRTKSCIKIFEF